MEVDKETTDQDLPTSMEVDEETKDEVKPGSSQLNDAVVSCDETKDKDKKEDCDMKDLENIPLNNQDSKTDDLVAEREENKSSEPDLKEIIRLAAGASVKEDKEEKISLTADEVKQYLLKKIGEYMNSSVNPLFSLRAKVKELEERGKKQVEEYIQLYKGLQLLQRKHEMFLRNQDILPKLVMYDVSVSADLPLEPVPNAEALMKNDLKITKVDNTTNKTTPASSVPTNTKPNVSLEKVKIECIDLTDDVDAPPAANTTKSVNSTPLSVLKHPAPLPPRPFSTNVQRVPPKPRLKITAEDKGIVLQWDMPPNPRNLSFDIISNFEIFGYQEMKNSVISTLLWKKIGTVKAMNLPMACTLTQFVDGNKYHFAIRAVDVRNRCGHFSDAISIVYKLKK